MTFQELYRLLIDAANHNQLDQVIKSVDEGDKHNLDCLLYPSRHNIIVRTDTQSCLCDDHKCVNDCLFNAISFDGNNISFDVNKCVGCGICVDNCAEKRLTATSDLIEVIQLLRDNKQPIYALLAPAIVGQFGDNADIPRLRACLKSIGFTGVIEVATFADILTLREALDFAHRMDEDRGFQLTSCCCPVWIALIKKNFNKLSDHLSAAVSPMIAAGRTVKKLNPGAITVFVSPCLAKRSEAREPDIAGAIDNVITFKELDDLFNLLEINPSTFEPDIKEHSSFAGRVYARSGGVSEAVNRTYSNIIGGKTNLVSRCANGVLECKQMLNEILEGKVTANFFEGMGCVGGCVAGVKVLRDKAISTDNVNAYADKAEFRDPVHNPYIIKLLSELGFDKIGDLLSDDEMYCRKLN